MSYCLWVKELFNTIIQCTACTLFGSRFIYTMDCLTEKKLVLRAKATYIQKLKIFT